MPEIICPRCGCPLDPWPLHRPDNCGGVHPDVGTCMRWPQDVLRAPVARRPHPAYLAAVAEGRAIDIAACQKGDSRSPARRATAIAHQTGEETMPSKPVITYWMDRTEADRPWIVSLEDGTSSKTLRVLPTEDKAREAAEAIAAARELPVESR